MILVRRTIYFLFWTPIALYLTAIGWFLSDPILQRTLPQNWVTKINPLMNRLPYQPAIKAWLLGKLGWWYQQAQTWWSLVMGIPLIMVGICIFLIAFFNLIHSITSTAST